MKIRKTRCKTALSKSRLPGLDYSLNPYRGCTHNCAYCYVPNVMRISRGEWGSFVDIKTNIPVVLSKELKKKEKGIVGISTVTDPYQKVEKKYKLTRYCLEQLLIHDFPVCIQTKSDLILRDIDLISKFTDVEVMFSIGTINDSERKILEPNSPSIKARLDALKEFSKTNVNTSVFFGPIYPTINQDNVSKIIDVFISHGAKTIMLDKFNLKPGILENIIKSNPKDIKNLDNKKYYEDLFKEIKKICKEKNVDFTEAF